MPSIKKTSIHHFLQITKKYFVVRRKQRSGFSSFCDVTIGDYASNLSGTTHHLVAPPFSINMGWMRRRQQQLICMNAKLLLLKGAETGRNKTGIKCNDLLYILIIKI